MDARRYVALNGQDLLKTVAVQDIMEELNAALKRAGINPKTPLPDALKTLERAAPNVAEALMFIATTCCRQTSAQYQP